MPHFTIEEAIKIINRKTDQSLTRRHIAQLCETWELQLCFECQTYNCHLGICDESAPFDLISEVKLIGMRRVNNREPLYLAPSYDHKDAVFDAITDTSKSPIEIQFVRKLGHKRQRMLLIRDIGDQYLYDIGSKYKNGWQLFNSPKYFFEFEREEGASASYTITVDSLRITDASLNAYIAKTKAKPVVLVEVVDQHIDPMNPALRIAIQIMGIIPSEHHPAVIKAGLAEAILDILRRMGYSKKIKNENGVAEVESNIIRSVGRWIGEAKPNGGWGLSNEVRPPTKDEQKQSRTLINDAVAALFECNNSQN